MAIEVERVFYEHENRCDRKTFGPVDEITGLKKCLDCAGVFDKDGKGVAVTDKRFDEWRYNNEDEPVEGGDGD